MLKIEKIMKFEGSYIFEKEQNDDSLKEYASALFVDEPPLCSFLYTWQ